MKIEEIESLAIALEELELDGTNKEAIQRTSCSKHYYHLFHVVTVFFQTKFTDIYKSSGGATHQAIRVCCELLADHFNDKDFKKLALKLKTLHDIRVSADYRLIDSFNANNLLVMKIEKNKAILLIESLHSKYSSGFSKQA